jgi:hypothetical protein
MCRISIQHGLSYTKIHSIGQNVLFNSQTAETSTIIQACSRLISLLVQEKEKTSTFIGRGEKAGVGLKRGPADCSLGIDPYHNYGVYTRQEVVYDD